MTTPEASNRLQLTLMRDVLHRFGVSEESYYGSGGAGLLSVIDQLAEDYRRTREEVDRLTEELTALRARVAGMNRTPSIFVANLTHEEYAAFHAKPFIYSGGTGDCNPEVYKGGGLEHLAPCIATWLSEVYRPIELFGWTHVTMRLTGRNWIMRGGRKNHRA